MERFLAIAIFAFGWASLVMMVNRNLRQRTIAREFRTKFIAMADQLVSNAEFPVDHARQLVGMTRLREGWLTRFMFGELLKVMVLGEQKESRANAPRIEQVPPHLRAKYVVAILSFVIADSYRCALLGRFVRGMNPWMFDAIKEVKPDVNAHATRSVVNLVHEAKPPRRPLIEEDLLCAV